MSTAKQPLNKTSHHTELGVIATAAALAIALVIGGAAAPAEAKEKKSGEEELAELLEGRVAGEPQRCIRHHISNHMRTIDDTAFVFGRGKTIYVQRTKNPEDIDDNDVLVIRKFGSSKLCRLDQVTKVDSLNGFYAGNVFFEDFIPYTKVEDNQDTEDSEGGPDTENG